MEPMAVPNSGTPSKAMNVIGIGRLQTVRAHPRLEPRVVSWLAELGAAEVKNMSDITKKFGSARPISDQQVEFALAEDLFIDTLVSFPGHTLVIRFVRVFEPMSES